MNRSVGLVALGMVLLAILLLVGYLIALRTRQELPARPVVDHGFTPAVGVPAVASNPPGNQTPPSGPTPAGVPPATPTVKPADSPASPVPEVAAMVKTTGWEPLGLSGGGSMFTPAISPLDSKRMMVNCDMSGAYISEDGGHNWQMINGAQLGGNTRCRPCWSPSDKDTIYAAGGWGGHLMVSHDAGKTWTAVGDIKDSLVGEIAIDADLIRILPGEIEYSAKGGGGLVDGPLTGGGVLRSSQPQHFLVGTRSGALMSIDGAVSFQPCSGVTGSALAFHFDQTSGRDPAHRVCFVATTDGIWRSDDTGKTWQKKMAGLPAGSATKITAFAGGSTLGSKPEWKPLLRLYCSVPCSLENGALVGGVFRSDDKGETWVRAMGEGINVDTKKFDQYAEGDLPQYTYVFTTDANPEIVYALNRSTGFWPPHQPTVYRSEDGGLHWKATLFMDPRFKEQFNVDWEYHTATMHQSYQEGAEGAAIAPNDPNTLIRVGSMEALITHDGGKTWFPGHTRLAPGEKPEPNAAFECNGLVVTTTWHYYIDPFEANRHYICYTDIGFARSLDAGKTWRWWDTNSRPPWTNTTYELAFDPAVKGKIWGAFSNVHDIPNSNIISGRHGAQGPGGVAVSTDFGQSWQTLYESGAAGALPSAPVTSLCVDPTSPQDARVLYAAVFDVGLFKSVDGGKTWAKKSQGLGAPENMRLYRVIRHADGTLFALITGKQANRKFLSAGVGVYKSTDGAESWTQINRSQPFWWPKDLTVDPQDSKVLYVGACDGNGEKQSGLWRTKDGGATWQNLGREASETFGGYPSQSHPGWIYMTLTEGAAGPGLWLSKDDGKTWLPFKELPFRNIMRVTEDPADKNKIYVSTFGGSVWHGLAEPAP